MGKLDFPNNIVVVFYVFVSKTVIYVIYVFVFREEENWELLWPHSKMCKTRITTGLLMDAQLNVVHNKKMDVHWMHSKM